MTYRFDSDAFTRRPAAMQRLYLVEMYDPRQNRSPCFLWTFEDRTDARAEAERYAENCNFRLRSVTHICVTPDNVDMEI